MLLPERGLSNAEVAFSRLIGPLEPAAFFDEYWAKQPLALARQQPEYYAELLSMQDTDQILTSTDFRFPSARLIKNGAPIAAQKYAADITWGNELAHGVVDVGRLLDEYERGATILLQSAQRYWRPLSLFCRSIERYLSHPVHANVYLTPKASQGLALHQDPQETFILQAAGSKHWRVYGTAAPQTPGGQAEGQAPPGQPLKEFDLNAGDLLYMPRGFPHEVATQAAESLHITLTVSAYTWAEVFAEAMSFVRQDPRFRKLLPIGFVQRRDTWAELQSEFAELLGIFTEKADLDQLLDAISTRFVSSRNPKLDGHLMDLTGLDALDSHTVVRRRAEVLYRLVRRGDSVSLVFPGKKLEFPKETETALRYVLEQDEFAAEDIAGEISSSEKKDLVRRLVAEGLLTMVRGA